MIQEYAELNKDIFSPVCESTYEARQIEEVAARGDEAVIAKMRTLNFFPPSSFSERIAQRLAELMASDEQGMVEVYCDDSEFLTKSLGGVESFEKVEDEEEEEDILDDFIDDDLSDGFDDDVKSDGKGSAIDIEEDVLEDEDEEA